MIIFQILADFIPHRSPHPDYYVVARTKTEAKKIFSGFAPWLEIYEVNEMTKEEADNIIKAGKRKHIVFNRNAYHIGEQPT